MLRLMGELAELPPDPVARSRHLLAGLCGLIGAEAATDVVSRRVRNGPRRREVCAHAEVFGRTGPEQAVLARYFARMGDAAPDPIATWVYACTEAGRVRTRPRRAIVDDPGWRESAHYHEVRRPSSILEPLVHCRPAGDGRHVRTVCLHREDEDRPFGDREAGLLRLFMGGAARLLPPPGSGSAVLAPTPAGDLARLSPRERDVIDGLLAGRSAKQVAARLGLSRHTVGDYVKAVYRKLGVDSRGELMARFIGSPPPPPADPTCPGAGGQAHSVRL